MACLQCLQFFKKEVRDKVDFFCLQVAIKVSYKLMSILWALKFSQDDAIIIDAYDQEFSKYSK